MSGRVVVVGSVNVDLVVVAPRLPGPGETVTGGDVARHHGGKGGNQAVAAARLGAPVAFVGAVGDDDFGAAARAALAGEGIDVTHLAAVGRPTGVALIVVDARAENLIAVAPGANASPTAASVAAALGALGVGPGDVVLASCEVPPDAVAAALATARAAGATAVLNPAPADGLDAATIALADVLTPNEAELALLAGSAAVGPAHRPAGPGLADVEAHARRLLAGGPAGRAVVVTLGSAGAAVVPAAGPSPPWTRPAPATPSTASSRSGWRRASRWRPRPGGPSRRPGSRRRAGARGAGCRRWRSWRPSSGSDPAGSHPRGE
jgi:ribokinase